ncbi:hypothetical protein ACFVYE_11875 [Streptomyces sp. NPDC058239]|uniref:hypothetical protein n=1 Tax=Streptomyces sp. NPDC058239 TaxID=3346395 RepID=UPI0036F0FC88
MTESYEQGAFDEEDDEFESIDSLLASWHRQKAKLREIGDEARGLQAELTPWSGRIDRAHDCDWIVKQFVRLADAARKEDFESLILRTTELHHRGTGVLDPDHSFGPIPSPFVRLMPPEQATMESKRLARQVRHVVAYQAHIQYCIEHFTQAWNALIDGALICDWEIIEDEFPKLALLSDEAQRALRIWMSVDK